VDKQEAYLIIPLNEVAYAANDGSFRGIPDLKPNANYKSISVELCIEKDGTFHPETIKRAAQINSELCRMFGLDPLKDVTRKNCPAPWVKDPKKFDEFKRMVKTCQTLGVIQILEAKVMELNDKQKQMVDYLKSLKITNGENPDKEASQLYVWTIANEVIRVVYTDMNKMKKELKEEIAELKKLIK